MTYIQCNTYIQRSYTYNIYIPRNTYIQCNTYIQHKHIYNAIHTNNRNIYTTQYIHTMQYNIQYIHYTLVTHI